MTAPTASQRQQLRVLAMNSGSSAKIRSFFEAISNETQAIICDFATYAEVSFSIIDGKPQCIVKSRGTTLEDYDLIYFKTYFKYAEIAVAMAHIAKQNGVPFVDQEVISGHARTKLTQYVKLAGAGIAVPNTVIAPGDPLKSRYAELQRTLGDRFVMKDAAGERGETNYLVTSKEQFAQVCHEGESTLFACQQYIQSDSDYRVIVLGDSVNLIIERTAKDKDTYLTNTSSGGSIRRVEKEDFDSQGLAVAIKAAKTLDRQVAGVDLIFDTQTQKWLVLEVNNSPNMADHGYLEEKRKIMGDFLSSYAEKHPF